MITYKTDEEIELMRQSGKILTDVFKKTIERVAPGITTLELDNYARELIKEFGASPSFETVDNYKFVSCTCLNDCVVHGIPTNYKLKAGDILGLDMGILWKGWHSDASWSIIVGENSVRQKDSETVRQYEKRRKFLDIGEEALREAIKVTRDGNYIWDIGEVIERIVERKGGYHVVHSLTGHGIGRELHEEPFVPGFPEGKREKSPKIQKGMVLAIEVIYGEKSGKIWYGNSDGWTINIQDGSDAGLFEVTVAITAKGPEILTHLV